MAWSWEFMLQAFRALGGKAENIARKEGSGRGLIAVNPNKLVRLHAPEHLVFALADVEFVDHRLRIKDAAAIGKAERAFFDSYYDAFSWGGGGRDEAYAFTKGIQELPQDVRETLVNDFGLDALSGDGEERAEQWFLLSRMVLWKGRVVLVPVLDLVAHDSRADPYDETGGVAIVGQFPDEVKVLRSKLGPFGAFWRFGFASRERVAFSLPLQAKTDSGWQVTIGQNINLNSTLGSMPVPDYAQDGQSIQFSCLMIGNAGYPRLSRGIFYRVMRDAGEAKPEQIFDRILHENRMAYLNLWEALEPHEGVLISSLRKAVRYQLEAMSWCIGTRDL
jgi:hypothetical protein